MAVLAAGTLAITTSVLYVESMDEEIGMRWSVSLLSGVSRDARTRAPGMNTHYPHNFIGGKRSETCRHRNCRRVTNHIHHCTLHRCNVSFFSFQYDYCVCNAGLFGKEIASTTATSTSTTYCSYFILVTIHKYNSHLLVPVRCKWRYFSIRLHIPRGQWISQQQGRGLL